MVLAIVLAVLQERRWQRAWVLLWVLIVHGWLLQRQWLAPIKLNTASPVAILYLTPLREDVPLPVRIGPLPVSLKPTKSLLLESSAAPQHADDTPCQDADRCNPTVTNDMPAQRPPEIDWRAAAEVATQAAARGNAAKPRMFGPRTEDKQSTFEAEPKIRVAPKHKNGDVEQFDDGTKRIWVNRYCYLSTDNNGARFREFALGISDRSGSNLTCEGSAADMPSGDHMFESLLPKKKLLDK